jgi:diacylglycerol kinase
VSQHQGPLSSSFKHATRGLVFFLRTQRNIRLLFLIAVAVFAYAAKTGVSATEWALLVVAVVLVLAAEMLNSALEYTLDLLHPAQHPLVKAAKDIAAGAVLVTCLGAAAIGLLVFFG